MTDVEASQPAPGVQTSTADERLRGLIGDRFDALMLASPSYASYIGIHEHDGSLGDLSREAKEADIAAEHDLVTALQAVDVDSLSPRDDFERDLALHSARLRLFDAEVRRDWERRLGATEEIGDGLFVLLARETAPLRERLTPMAQRLEAVPTALQQVRDRLGDQPVRLWNEVEVASARELPSLIDEIVAAGPGGDGVSSASADDPQLSTEESRPPGLPEASGDGTTPDQPLVASADLDETSTTAPPTTESGASSRTQTSTEAPTTTTVDTSSLPPTTTVESACGSIGFEVDGSEVRLVKADPAESYQADVKNSGPEKIEVSFEGGGDGGDHCELEIQFVNGELLIEEDD